MKLWDKGFSIDKKIELMEQLVDIAVLNEQFFSPSMETARIKGEANDAGADDKFNVVDMIKSLFSSNTISDLFLS